MQELFDSSPFGGGPSLLDALDSCAVWVHMGKEGREEGRKAKNL